MAKQCRIPGDLGGARIGERTKRNLAQDAYTGGHEHGATVSQTTLDRETAKGEVDAGGRFLESVIQTHGTLHLFPNERKLIRRSSRGKKKSEKSTSPLSAKTAMIGKGRRRDKPI